MNTTPRARTFALDLLCLALLAVIAFGTGNLILKAALGFTETITRAEALKGM